MAILLCGIFLLPMLVQSVRDLRQPRPVLNWFQYTSSSECPAIVGFKNYQTTAGFCQTLHQPQAGDRGGFELLEDTVQSASGAGVLETGRLKRGAI